MKFQIVFIGSLFVLAACKPAEDVGTAQQLLRSCDRNADNALNAAEFAGCLMQTSRQQRMAAQRTAVSRTELLQSFMDEADKNDDLRADETELQEWSKQWLKANLLRNDGNGLSFGEVVSKIVLILQYFGEQNYIGAVVELYALLSGYELTDSSQVSINLAIVATNAGNYGQAIGHIYAVIREIAGGDDAGGIFVVSASTVTSVGSLLQAVIEGDSADVNFYFYRSLAGLIVDFSFLTEQSANTVAEFIQAVIENDSERLSALFEIILNDVLGDSSEVVIAVAELLDTVINGPSNLILSRVFRLLSVIFENENATDLVRILGALVGAIIRGDTEETIEQLTLLYALLTSNSSGGTGSDDFSSDTILAFADIVNSLAMQNGFIAIFQIRSLINSGSSGLSSSQIDTLGVIINEIKANDLNGATAGIVAIATSKSSGSVEISVEEFKALSKVITFIYNSDSNTKAILLIQDILSDSSITISSEIRSALKDLMIILATGTIQEARAEITAIIAGTSSAYN